MPGLPAAVMNLVGIITYLYRIEAITGQRGIVDFTLPDGKVIPNGQDGRSRGIFLNVREMNRENGIEITSGTSIPLWYGDRMDHQVTAIRIK